MNPKGYRLYCNPNHSGEAHRQMSTEEGFNPARNESFHAWVARFLLLIALVTLPAAVQAQFDYTTENGQITITRYTGAGGAVDIPSTINGLPVTRIGENAFYGATSLTSVTIPNNVMGIGAGAFIGCVKLTSIVIPDGVTNIGFGPFVGCTHLSEITVQALNAFYSSAKGFLFDKSQTRLIQCPGAKAGSYTIPTSVTNIGVAAFQGCTSLTSVSIGNSVSTILDGAFAGCTSLTSATIPDSVTNMRPQAFASCTGLTNVAIGNSVSTIEDGAFAGCTSLTNIIIPRSVTSIGEYAFADCTSLTNVTIPDGCTEIGQYAFGGCTSLTNVTIGNSVNAIASEAFVRCTSLTNVTFGNSVSAIRGGAFWGCTSLTNVTIPRSVISVQSFFTPKGIIGAFYGCINLTGIFFLGNVPKEAGPNTFLWADNAVVYYLPGTTGWDMTFAERPTALWSLPYPVILSSGPSFGASPDGFGFLISWATNASVVVEASPSLAAPAWTPVSTNTLTAGTSPFTDPQWTNHPARLYRVVSR
ncbi:MAG TPA: leucine-rich repeat domain-containing protein [Verrucomicrobiota bacterium]|nr:leucine-rich repeat domain-containing protein [Verrucomicrobiota bacterium]